MKFSLIDDWQDLAALQPEWNGLLASSATDNFFQTWEYLDAWRRVCEDRFECRTLVARDAEDRLVGLAPLIIGPGRTLARRHLRHLAFAGQLMDSATDCCDFIIARGNESEVMRGFADVILGDLAKDWHVLHFSAILANSTAMKWLFEALSERRFKVRRIHERSAAFASLPDSWDAFLAAKSSHFRKNARRIRRKLERDFEVEFVDGAELEIDEAFSNLVRLNHARWRDSGRAFRSEEFNQLHRQLLKEQLGSGGIALNFLTLDGVFVAVNYDFIHANKVWGFQAGWDPEFAKFSVFRGLFGFCLEDFMRRGLSEYDFLAGDAGYKESWATGARRVQDFEAINPRSLRGRIFSFARSLRSAA